MTTREEAFKEINEAVWFEDCEQMSDDDERLISMGTLRRVFFELALLRDVRIEMQDQIDSFRPHRRSAPPSDYSKGELTVWKLCLDLVTNGVESSD